METKEKNEYKVVIKEITPERAKAMLERNVYNRKIKQAIILSYASQMEEGRWRENVSQPIAFDEDGNLLDGQHRLHAVVKANKAVRMAVMYGARKVDFGVVDTGAPRCVGDVLSIKGVPSPTAIASIVKVFWQLKRDTTADDRRTIRLTNEMGYDEYCRNPELYQYAARMANRVYVNSRLLPVSEIGGICVYLICEKQHTTEQVEQFFAELTGGASLNATQELRRIITRSNNAPASKSKIQAKARRALIAKAWNAFISGIDVRRLIYNPEHKTYWL